jgi:holo-[acyl-carrier protein] synthase
MNINLPPGGILINLGCDVIEISRIKGVTERHGQRFLDRVFTADELAYCLPNANIYQHLAVRFAAKEAISKCFTTGIGPEFGWRSASIVHGERQEPIVLLDEKTQALVNALGGTRVLISLSHSETVAMAVAALVK